MSSKAKKIIFTVVLIILIASIFTTTVFAAQSLTLSWKNQTKATRFNVVLDASSSIFRKYATITITNDSKSQDRIIVYCVKKDSSISGVSASGNFLYIGPGQSRSYKVSVKAINCGTAKFEVNTQTGGAKYSYKVTVSGGATHMIGKCL